MPRLLCCSPAHHVVRPAIMPKQVEFESRRIAIPRSNNLEERLSRLEVDVNELKTFNAQLRQGVVEAKKALDADDAFQVAKLRLLTIAFIFASLYWIWNLFY